MLKEKGIVDIINFILLQREYSRQRFGNFVFETLKAYHNDCILRNPYASATEILHANAELGKYVGKCIRGEY